MSENIQSISQGTFTIGQTSATNFIAGQGIKIDSPSAGTVRIGNDETVLYNNTAATTADVAIGSTFYISEPITNFDKFKIYYSRFPVSSNGASNGGPCSQIREYDSTACSSYFVINETFPTNTTQNPDWFDISMLIETISGTTWKCKACYQSKLPSGSLDRGWTYLKPYKVIGINRISGSNA